MSLYIAHKGHRHPFVRNVRLKLLHFLISAPKRFGGCSIPNKCLHDSNELLKICTHPWVMPWQL
eukprot:gene46711-58242_t